jgi:hypothetical protein
MRRAYPLRGPESPRIWAQSPHSLSVRRIAAFAINRGRPIANRVESQARNRAIAVFRQAAK